MRQICHKNPEHGYRGCRTSMIVSPTVSPTIQSTWERLKIHCVDKIVRLTTHV